MQRVKTARDKLSVVGVQIDDDEMLHMILKGLPKENSSFNSAIRTRDDSLTFEKLFVLERKHTHLIQTTLALMSQSGLSLSYWSYALATASHLINKLPTPLLNMSSP